MNYRSKLLSSGLGRYLKVHQFVQRQLSRIDHFIGGLALGALDSEGLLALTSAAYEARDWNPGDTLYPWEEKWFAEDLPPAPAKILLGGAGDGRETLVLARQGYQVVAFEPVPKLLKKMSARAKSLPGVSCYPGSYEDLLRAESALARQIAEAGPYEAVILGWGSFTHVPDSRVRQQLLQRLRSLCPVGPVLISFWAADGYTHPAVGKIHSAGFTLGGYVRGATGEKSSLNLNDQFTLCIGYGHFFNQQEMQELAAGAGYAVALMECDSRPGSFPHTTLIPRD